MAISRIGTAVNEAATITIPVGHQAGDLLIIFAFRDDGVATAPSTPAGWTSLGSQGLNTIGHRTGWKLATSSSETSGTWTNATGTICHVYRGVATNKTPVGSLVQNANNNTTVLYNALNPLKCPGTSWVAAFAGHGSLDTALETPPTGLANQTTLVGAIAEYAGHDSNGVISFYAAVGGGNLSVSVGGTAAGWGSSCIEIFAEQKLYINAGLKPRAFAPGIAR